MATYDEIRTLVENSSDGEKLQILRSESRRVLSTVQGYSHLIHDLAKERDISDLPDDFLQWCEVVIKGTVELQDLIEGVTDHEHRSIYQQERAQRDKELAATLWKDAQTGLPELRSYSGLKEAVEQLVQQMGLSFQDKQIKVDDLGNVIFYFGDGRRTHIGTQSKPIGREYSGYSVLLGWLTDSKNIKGNRKV
jgi:hypothetical protein